MKKSWSFSYYFLYFVAFASLMPFLVLFYQQRGFNGPEISLLTGVPPLITMVSAPFWTGLADVRRWHKALMSLGIAVAALMAFFLPIATSFAAVFIVVLLFNIFLAPVPSLADSATMTMLGDERAMYGRIRLGGTIGWGLFAPIAGLMAQKYGLTVVFWFASVVMLLNLFLSQKFVYSAHERDGLNPGGIRTLLTNRRWIFFLLLALLGGIGSSAAAAYLYPYMAELGASESMMGLALTISTLSEIPIFFFGHRLVKKFGSHGLLTLALVFAGMRGLLYVAARTPLMVLGVQAFGGMIFPAMWTAGVSYADEHAPAGLKSSAQGLFGAAFFGIGSAISGFISGLLLQSIGGRGLFLVLSMIVLVGLGIIEGARRLFPEKEDLPRAVPIPSDK